MMNLRTFSIVCPIRNEENYIGNLLKFLETVQPKPKEVILIDGISEDDTLNIIDLCLQKSTLPVTIISNQKKTVPFALNLAIPLCTSDIIVRIDAHSEYDIEYFKKILETFDETDADIVGGPTRTTFRNIFQESVAYIFNTNLGMGNSSVHNVDFKGYTDSVTFGAWKKSIFETTGFFDVNLKRNQDDEFHYRAKSLGFKIFQNPDIKLFYYPRSTLKGLFKQYFEYGLFKPIVLQKIKSEIKLRHIIPSFFVGYLTFLLLLRFFGQINFFFWIPLFLYFTIVLFYSFNNALILKAKIISFFAYPAIHIGYGLGFLIGLGRLKVRKD